MIVATFGPSTGWVGKTIAYDEERFTLEGLGQITAQAVVDYDRQGHLTWAYDGLREWAYQSAGQPAPVAPLAAAAAAAPETASAAPTAAPPTASPAPPHTAAPVVPVDTQHLVTPAPADITAATAPPQPPVMPAATEPPVAEHVTAAASPPPAPKASKGWVTWLVAGAVVLVALLIGIVFAGGRLREGLGIALTLLAVVFVALLVVAAIRPAAAGRWFPGLNGRTLLVVSGALVAGCFVFAAFLWWMPHYEVVAPSDKRIALDDVPELNVIVVNHGLFGGTYNAVYAVDGVEQDSITFPLGAGDERELTVSIPPSTPRGDVLLSLGGASIEARAVAPPTFAVAPLQIEPAVAKLGDDVVLTTTVENTGDMEGTFGGVLLADGEELLTQPVEISAGASTAVTYDLTADVAGEYRFDLGDATAKYAIVKPVRLANGYVLKRSVNGGRAYVTVTNKTGQDAMVVLTRSTNKRKPVLAVYVRKGQKTKIKGIPDGNYVLWDCCGADWNWHMRDFYTTTEHKRWTTPLKFDTTASTRRWTSYWSDASYNYSQGHSRTTTQWTNWTVTLGAGESKYTKSIAESGFPQL